MEELQLFCGITKDDELYFLEIEFKDQNKEFSISALSVEPISEKDGEDRAREMLEDGELWKMAVENGNTEMGLSDWVDEVLAIDGWEQTLDCSLHPESIRIDDIDYSFISHGCGQHEKKELKEYFIDKKFFDELMALWKKHHLKKYNNKQKVAEITEKIKGYNKTKTELVIKAVKTILNL